MNRVIGLLSSIIIALALSLTTVDVQAREDGGKDGGRRSESSRSGKDAGGRKEAGKSGSGHDWAERKGRRDKEGRRGDGGRAERKSKRGRDHKDGKWSAKVEDFDDQTTPEAAQAADRREREKELADKIADRGRRRASETIEEDGRARALAGRIIDLNKRQLSQDRRENRAVNKLDLGEYARLQRAEDRLERRERNLDVRLSRELGFAKRPDFGNQNRGPIRTFGDLRDLEDLGPRQQDRVERLVERIERVNAKQRVLDQRENRAVRTGHPNQWFGGIQVKEDKLERRERQLVGALANLLGAHTRTRNFVVRDEGDGGDDDEGGGNGNGGGPPTPPDGPPDGPPDDPPDDLQTGVRPISRDLVSFCAGLPDDPQRLDREQTLCFGALLLERQASEATEAIRRLGRSIADKDPAEKGMALETIGTLNRGFAEALPLLVQAQLDGQSGAASAASAALAAVGGYVTSVLGILRPYVTSSEPDVAQSAAEALGELGAYGGEALHTLAGVLDVGGGRDVAPLGLTYGAAAGITKIDTAIARLRGRVRVTGRSAVSQSHDLWRREEAEGLRWRAADRLAGLAPQGGRAIARAGDRLEAGSPAARRDAARSLGQTGRVTALALAALLDAARDPTTSELRYRSPGLDLATGRQPASPEALLARTLPGPDADLGRVQAIALRDSLRAVHQAEERLGEIAREAGSEPDLLGRVASFRAELERRRREATGPLLAALDRVPASTRVIVVEALGYAAPARPEPVITALQAIAANGGTPEERGSALLALGRLRAEAAIGQMAAVVGDESAETAVRYQAARAMGLLGRRARSTVAVRALDSQLRAPDPGLAYNAARALAEIQPTIPSRAFDSLFNNPAIEADIGRLVERVEGGGATERATALRRLAQIGPPAVSAVPALVSVLGRANADERLTISETIVQIAGAALDDLPFMTAKLGQSDVARHRIVDGLASIHANVESAIKVLAETVKQPPDRASQVAAATSLVSLNGLATRITTGLLEASVGERSGTVPVRTADALSRAYREGIASPAVRTVAAAGRR